eukprot:5708415-Alexandrium_andersonii.AAC.1
MEPSDKVMDPSVTACRLGPSDEVMEPSDKVMDPSVTSCRLEPSDEVMGLSASVWFAVLVW